MVLLETTRNDFVFPREDRRLVLTDGFGNTINVSPDNPASDAVAYIVMDADGDRVDLSLCLKSATVLRNVLTILINERS